MANSKQSEKRARQNLSRYKLKHAQRSRIRTAVKSVRSAIDSNNQKEFYVYTCFKTPCTNSGNIISTTITVF